MAGGAGRVGPWRQAPASRGGAGLAAPLGGAVVFTNGVFDLLHRGHVALLVAARAEGAALVVGLNSDASVRRLKGPERPFNAERDRAYVLGALGCVDAVVLFDDDTPAELIAALRARRAGQGRDYAPADRRRRRRHGARRPRGALPPRGRVLDHRQIAKMRDGAT